jgi:hypothetical protein
MVNKKATDMNIDRLPTSSTETPQLLGSYDAEKNSVVWALDGKVLHDSQSFMDGTNWFIVWRIGDVIHCQATQWYNSRGDFCLRVTDLTPDQVVAIASQSATIASNYYEGDIKLERTS